MAGYLNREGWKCTKGGRGRETAGVVGVDSHQLVEIELPWLITVEEAD